MRSKSAVGTCLAKQHYSEREARKCFAQMVEAIGHCHAHEIVHRDLKPENLLYADVEGTPNGEVIKLADFGLASIIHVEKRLTAEEWPCGAEYYRDPRAHSCYIGALKITSTATTARARLSGSATTPRPWTVRVSGVQSPPQILTATSRAGHIPHFCDNMHKYVLRRHLKGAVDAVIATKRMGSSRLMGLFASASETPTSVVETPAATTTEAAPAAAPAAATA